MDVFSHALWGNLEFRLIPQTREHPHLIGWGIFFSVFPDLLTFTYPFLWLLWHRYIVKDLTKWPETPADYEALPIAKITHTLYDYSHSIVIWTGVTAIVWAIMGSFPWILIGWVTHIFIDMPVHERDFFITPFLWPLSRFGIDGYAWNNRDFMAFNIITLIATYMLFFYT
jgi:hypothetical protein